MAYTKIVQSGTLLEVFEYENEPLTTPRSNKKLKYRNTKRYTRNVWRARKSFFRLVRANVSATKRPALLTLTMREVVSIKQGWRSFTSFAQRLRYQMPSVAFIAVPEFQERGAVHFHVLVWGLTDEQIISERHTRRIALLWRHGFIDIRSTDGSPKLAGYLSKYMFKAMWDERLSGTKSYSGSRNLMRSVSLNTPFQVDTVKAEFDLESVDNPPLQIREYQTKWLGKCIYKVYSSEKDENKS